MNESLYFKNGKPRKHPKKIKAVIVTDLGGTLADWDYLYKLKKKIQISNYK